MPHPLLFPLLSSTLSCQCSANSSGVEREWYLHSTRLILACHHWLLTISLTDSGKSYRGKQPFERKSLWHISAPWYHIHTRMGANFETACTVLRTCVPAGAWKDESLPLFSKSFCPSVPFKGTHCSCMGCPGNSGCQWPSPHERKQLERKTSWVLAGERFHLVNQNLQPEPMLNVLELPTSSLTAGCPQVRRTTQELHRLTTDWVQFQTLNGSALL